MRYSVLLIALISISSRISFGQQVDSVFNTKNSLTDTLISIISRYKASIGVSIIAIEEKETVLINNDRRFPMQSVYKFPLAIAVLKKVDEGVLSLDQKIYVKKSDLHNTWSPLKEKYPEGNLFISVRELLAYTISRSDNNTCDILFGLLGGPKKVDTLLHSIGIKNISIVATEYEMSKKWSIQYKNSTNPLAMSALLENWYQNQILSDSSTQFLNKIMVDNYTSKMRIKGLLPESIVVAHKTGSSGTNKKGISAGTNDVGIITLPNGHHLAISVFVSDSSENYETNESIIAEIAFAAFKYYSKT